ncbi:MAG: glycosyltransferase family 4 protein [Deltaproteobacteria bacterium]|nr:glycosyltransferase family 4 protein [Deltaproteobacteria bacterium]
MYTYEVFSYQAYGGISRYLVEVMKRIPAEEARVQVFAGLHINQYLKGLPGVIGMRVPALNYAGFGRRIVNGSIKRIRMLVNNLVQRALIRIDDQTILHLSYYTRRNFRNGVKIVVTVYDMIHELFPQYFSPRDETTRLKRSCCERADKVIAISHCTKRDLVNLLGIDDNKVSVIYLGNSLENTMPEDCVKIVDRPYLLYVGERGGYKNFSHLIKAFSHSPLLRNDFVLVCFGGRNFTPHERRRLSSLGIDHLVHYVSGSDSPLAGYYKNARALVFPSLYEGFGLPPLEAMGLGCPVICSNKGPITEIVGEAGIYFDPEDVNNMQYILEKALYDDTLLEEMVKRGYQRSSTFSWDRTARQTLALYRSLL